MCWSVSLDDALSCFIGNDGKLTAGHIWYPNPFNQTLRYISHQYALLQLPAHKLVLSVILRCLMYAKM